MESPLILTEETPDLPVSPAVTPRRVESTQKKLSPSISITSSLNHDPEVTQLLRAQRELEKQLREVKEQLETAEQALKIEAESRKASTSGVIDIELVALTEKWKGASRQAAEELFGKVRDRVNRFVFLMHPQLRLVTNPFRRMGGPRAWKEMQKKQQEFQKSWDQEVQIDGDRGERDDGVNAAEKQDLYAEYGIDEETENEKSQRVKGLGDTGEIPGQEDVSIDDT